MNTKNNENIDFADEKEHIAAVRAEAKRSFSLTGIALTVILVITTALQYLLAVAVRHFTKTGSAFAASSWCTWLITFIPMYLIAVPVGLLIFKKIPAEKLERDKPGAKDFISALLACLPVMYAGNIIGTLLSFLLSGGTAENGITSYAMDTNPLKIVVMVFLAPIIEEYIFRKQIIDRTVKFGEKTAIIFSGITFGLFHQNFFQFFYAFGIGVIFAYVYIHTGNIRYTMIMHGIINFLGGVAAPFVISLLDLDALNGISSVGDEAEAMKIMKDILPGLAIYFTYAFMLFALSVAGLVILILRLRRLSFDRYPERLQKGERFRTIYLNAGIIIFVILCTMSFVLALL